MERLDLRNLNLGCGHNKIDEFWNVDVNPGCNPDQVLDLNQTPWPWPDNSFDKISSIHCLEQLGANAGTYINIIKEMYRVSADQAIWEIMTPHWRHDFFISEPANVRPVLPETFAMFDQEQNIKEYGKSVPGSRYGLLTGADIELVDVKYDIHEYWVELFNAGELSKNQFEKMLKTQSNFCYQVKIYCRVHKPGRGVWFINTRMK